MRNYRKILHDLSSAYRDETGLSIATIGDKVARDADFFPNIAKGGTCTVDTYLKVRDWLRKNLAIARKNNAAKKQLLNPPIIIDPAKVKRISAVGRAKAHPARSDTS